MPRTQKVKKPVDVSARARMIGKMAHHFREVRRPTINPASIGSRVDNIECDAP